MTGTGRQRTRSVDAEYGSLHTTPVAAATRLISPYPGPGSHAHGQCERQWADNHSRLVSLFRTRRLSVSQRAAPRSASRRPPPSRAGCGSRGAAVTSPATSRCLAGSGRGCGSSLSPCRSAYWRQTRRLIWTRPARPATRAAARGRSSSSDGEWRRGSPLRFCGRTSRRGGAAP